MRERWIKINDIPEVHLRVSKLKERDFEGEFYRIEAKGNRTPDDLRGRGDIATIKLGKKITFQLRSVSFPAIGFMARAIYTGGADSNKDDWHVKGTVDANLDRVWGDSIREMHAICNRPIINKSTKII